jgi:hypothetical protein
MGLYTTLHQYLAQHTLLLQFQGISLAEEAVGVLEPMEPRPVPAVLAEEVPATKPTLALALLAWQTLEVVVGAQMMVGEQAPLEAQAWSSSE